jgi:hypothetical protein
MKFGLVAFALIIFYSFANAQKSNTLKGSPADTTVYSTPEVEPTFPGGMSKLFEYLAKNARMVDEKDVSIQMSFLFQMVIEKDGSVTNVKELRRTPNTETGKSIIKVLEASPKWNPGMKGGKPVRLQYSIPLYF